MRVHEATTEKKASAKQQPYEPKKPQTRGQAREDVPPTRTPGASSTKCMTIPYVTAWHSDTSWTNW